MFALCRHRHGRGMGVLAKRLDLATQKESSSKVYKLNFFP